MNRVGPLYVRISTLHGQQLLHCALPEFQRLQEGLLRRYSVLRIDAAGAPEETPLIPSLYPFRDPPTVLLSTPTDVGSRLSLEIPIVLKGGSIHRLLLDVSIRSTDPIAMMKALRSEIHKRVPLGAKAMESYKDWWESTAQDVVTQALEEQDDME